MSVGPESAVGSTGPVSTVISATGPQSWDRRVSDVNADLGPRHVAGFGATGDAALDRLNRHHLLDRFVSVMGRIGETGQGAFARSIAPVDDAGYGGAIGRAERPAQQDGLEEAARRRLRAELEAHAALAMEWLEFERLFREAEELDAHYREIEERAAHEGVPRSLLSEWAAWRERNLRVAEDARWALGDDRIDEYRRLRPGMLDRIEDGLRRARGREAIPSVEEGRIAEMVGAELTRLRDPGAEHAFTEPWWGREPLLAGDRIGLQLSEGVPEREAVVRRLGWTGGCVPGDKLEIERIGAPPGRDPGKRVEIVSALDLAGSGVHRAEWRDGRVREAERTRQFPAPPAGFPFPSGQDIAVGDRLWRTEVAGPEGRVQRHFGKDVQRFLLAALLRPGGMLSFSKPEAKNQQPAAGAETIRCKVRERARKML